MTERTPYFVMATIAAAMLIGRTVQLFNGHSLDSVFEMTRVERCGIVLILTSLTVLSAVKHGDLDGWIVVGVMTAVTAWTLWSSLRKRSKTPPAPNPDSSTDTN